MIPTILGLIQATSLQRTGTSSQMVMAVQAVALCHTLSHSYGASLQSFRHWIHHKLYSHTRNKGFPAHSLLFSSYSKFAMAELGRNKLHLLRVVSLASTLSRVLEAQQGIQLLISTSPTPLFSPPPCHQPQRTP